MSSPLAMKQPSISNRIPSRASMDGAVEKMSTALKEAMTSLDARKAHDLQGKLL